MALIIGVGRPVTDLQSINGVALTGRDWSQDFANLDTPLSTRASENTLQNLVNTVATESTLSTRASEDTLKSIDTKVATESTLSAINDKLTSNFKYESNLKYFAGAGVQAIPDDTVIGFKDWSWMILLTDNSADVHVRFEGSIDGENFFVLDEYIGNENTLRHVVNKPVRYVRINVINYGNSYDTYYKIFGIR